MKPYKCLISSILVKTFLQQPVMLLNIVNYNRKGSEAIINEIQDNSLHDIRVDVTGAG